MAIELNQDAVGGLIIAVLSALGAGKYWRAQRRESADTNAHVAIQETNLAVIEGWNSQFNILRDQIKTQGEAIDRQSTEIKHLKKELDRREEEIIELKQIIEELRNSTNSHENRAKIAVGILNSISLCDVCDPQSGKLIEQTVKVLTGEQV